MDIVRYSEADLPTVHGPFRLYVYREASTNGVPAPGSTSLEHMAIVRGDLKGQEAVLCRIHSECWTSEVIGSLKCDCREQLEVALARVAAEGSGVVVYLRQEGRGIGILNKVKAYALQDGGLDTVEANLHLGLAEDLRDYGIGAQVLAHLGVRRMRLLTNNPRKIVGISGYGLEVSERVPLVIQPRHEKDRVYLQAKKDRMGHLLG